MKLQSIFIVGAGFMGHGIAQTAASCGYQVKLYDISQDAVTKALEKIKWSVEKLHSKDPENRPSADKVLANISPAHSLQDAAHCQLVIEAVAELPAIKKNVFAELDMICPQETLFCSNTSAISISELAASTRRPTQFAGMHFFSPVPLMKLVEIVRGLETSDTTIQSLMELARAFGKEPVEVKTDPAGFIVNRILLAGAIEAIRILELGVADAATIDQAMKLGCGHKMGMLETCDMSGLDVMLNAAENIFQDTGDLKFKPPQLLQRLVNAGHLGRKTGRGFYQYES